MKGGGQAGGSRAGLKSIMLLMSGRMKDPTFLPKSSMIKEFTRLPKSSRREESATLLRSSGRKESTLLPKSSEMFVHAAEEQQEEGVVLAVV